DNVSIDVAAGPGIELLSPTSGSLFQESDRITIQATVTDPEDSPDTITVTLASDRDGDLGSASPDSDGDVSFSPDLSVGSHVLTLTATDGDGLSGTERFTLVVNGAPSAPTISLSPASPVTTDGLSVAIVTASVDPEGDTPTYTYSWTRDGASAGSGTASIAASSTAKGQEWTVQVVARDGDGGVSAAATASVTIVNSAPVLTSLVLTPADAYVDSTLEAAVGTSDADGDTVTVTYDWYVDGARVRSGTANSLSGLFEKDQTVEVVVTPEDDEDEGDSDDASVDILNSPPGAPTVVVTPEDPYAYDDMLTCTVTDSSDDADDDSVTYTYAWWVDGADSGRTGRTVAGSATAPGEEWECRVTPDDGDEAGDIGTARVVVLGDPVDYAHLQYPCSATVATGDELDVYGWVYELGVTDSTGEGAGIDAQVGYGAWGDDPSIDDSDWEWFDAAYFADKDGLSTNDNDEYLGTLTAPDTAGAYAYVFRFTTDFGASWIYADLGPESGCGGLGTTDGFDIDDAAPLTVTD
ncbi:MAG: hypothetical protein H6742_12420, partial [Alphaproteobacteria bacterium]|nr:hypothetical protein [Alphaproteobacteria bacterium]